MKVKDKYGFHGDIRQAVEHAIDTAPGYYDGQTEALIAKVNCMKGMLARLIELKISSTEELNAILGWGSYEDAE